MHADNHADNVQSVAEYSGTILECRIQDWWGVVRDLVYIDQHFSGARNAQFFSTSMILLQSVVKRQNHICSALCFIPEYITQSACRSRSGVPHDIRAATPHTRILGSVSMRHQPPPISHLACELRRLTPQIVITFGLRQVPSQCPASVYHQPTHTNPYAHPQRREVEGPSPS